jgi:hypothetical protein
MRYRIFAALIGMLAAAGIVSSSTPARAMVTRPMSADITATPTAVAIPGPVATDANCLTNGPPPIEGVLPKLSAPLVSSLQRYAQEPPPNASPFRWYDSGGRFGGGVPAGAVRSIMRKGLASGLSEGQVAGFLNPGFLRGVNDPFGGGSMLAFIADQSDPAFFHELAAYAGTVSPGIGGPMEAQSSLLKAFPLLDVVYEAQAGVAPLDESGAATMVDLAGRGYRPAQRTIGRILAAGNHPQAGAQGSGSVADQASPAVYDYFVANYRGPLSHDARVAVANRRAYLSWVDRIATWTAGGAYMARIPAPATFPAQPEAASPLSTGLDATC